MKYIAVTLDAWERTQLDEDALANFFEDRQWADNGNPPTNDSNDNPNACVLRPFATAIASTTQN